MFILAEERSRDTIRNLRYDFIISSLAQQRKEPQTTTPSSHDDDDATTLRVSGWFSYITSIMIAAIIA